MDPLEVVLTNPAHKGSGMVIKARELAEAHGWFWPRQFESEADEWVHAHATGPEILQAFGNTPLDYFVTFFGTGGTLKGVAGHLRRHSARTKESSGVRAGQRAHAVQRRAEPLRRQRRAARATVITLITRITLITLITRITQ